MKIEVTFIDWFGIVQTNAQQPPFPTGAVAPYSSQIRTTSRTIVDNKTYFAFSFADIAYAPVEVQKQFMLQGWSPQAMLAANAIVQNANVDANSFANTDLPISPQDAVAALALAWCLNFQDIGSPIVTPRIKITYQGNTSIVESSKYTWGQALEHIGNASIVDGKTIDLKTGQVSVFSIAESIKSANLKSLENKSVINYSAFEIAKNWDFWGIGSQIPVGCFFLKANSANVKLRDKPSSSGVVVSILNKGETVLQTLPIDKSGWWGAMDSNGKYGFISGSDVDMSPIIATQSTEITQAKPSTMLYIGIGASVLLLAAAAIAIFRKK